MDLTSFDLPPAPCVSMWLRLDEAFDSTCCDNCGEPWAHHDHAVCDNAEMPAGDAAFDSWDGEVPM